MFAIRMLSQDRAWPLRSGLKPVPVSICARFVTWVVARHGEDLGDGRHCKDAGPSSGANLCNHLLGRQDVIASTQSCSKAFCMKRKEIYSSRGPLERGRRADTCSGMLNAKSGENSASLSETVLELTGSMGQKPHCF